MGPCCKVLPVFALNSPTFPPFKTNKQKKNFLKIHKIQMLCLPVFAFCTCCLPSTFKLYIYAFDRCFYPKQLTLHAVYIFYQFLFSLGMPSRF